VEERADAVRDLLAAVLAGGRPADRVAVEPAVTLAHGVPAPDSARTLLEVLRWHAQRDPGRVHLVLRLEDDSEADDLVRSAVGAAGAVAGALRARGIAHGEAVALMLRTEPAFFSAFFGVLLAGAVPVPIYPPARPARLEEYATRQVKILDNAQARLLVNVSRGRARGRAPPATRAVAGRDDAARGSGRGARNAPGPDSAPPPVEASPRQAPSRVRRPCPTWGIQSARSWAPTSQNRIVAGRSPGIRLARDRQRMKEAAMTARELMTAKPATITPDTTIAEAWDLMRDLDIRHLPVVGDEGLIGMLSDRDLGSLDVPRLLTEAGAEALQLRLARPVVHLMSTDIVAAEPETDVSELVSMFLEHKVGAIAIVTPDTRQLVGIVSYIDVLRVLQEALEPE